MENKLFEHNLELLSRTHADLADRARAYVGPVEHVSADKRRYRMESAVKRLRRRTGLDRSALLIVLGIDDGALAYAVGELRPPNLYSAFFLEHSMDRFVTFLQTYDIEPVLSACRAVFLVAEPEDRMYGLFGTLLGMGLTHTLVTGACVWQDSASYSKHKTYYDHAQACIGLAVAAIVNSKRTNFVHSLEALRNRLGNLPQVVGLPKMHQLANVFDGKPGIVISAGPSLDKNLDELRACQGHAVLLCVNTVLRKVLAAGIRPDFVVSMDSSKAILPYYSGVTAEDVRDTTLVAISAVQPALFDNYPGPKALVYTASDFSMLDEADGEPTNVDEQGLVVGSSCAHLAFSVAEMLGCDPIVLVGQDLAYADNGDTHAGGINFAEGFGVTKRPFLDVANMTQLTVRGNIQPTVVTNAMWKGFIDRFCHLVAGCDRHVINATEGGAYIDGTDVWRLRDVRERLLDEAVDTVAIQRHLVAPALADCQDRVRGVLERHIPRLLDTLLDVMGRLNAVHIALAECEAAGTLPPDVLSQSLLLSQEILTDPQVAAATYASLELLITTSLMQHHGMIANEPNSTKLFAALVQLHKRYTASAVSMLAQILDVYNEFLGRPKMLGGEDAEAAL